jgi:hypothetical protein
MRLSNVMTLPALGLRSIGFLCSTCTPEALVEGNWQQKNIKVKCLVCQSFVSKIVIRFEPTFDLIDLLDPSCCMCWCRCGWSTSWLGKFSPSYKKYFHYVKFYSLMYTLAALNSPNFKQLYKITSPLLELSKCVAFDEKET